MRLKITDNKGLPLENVTVMISEADESFQDIAALTDENGYAELPGTNKAGNFTILLVHEGNKSIRRVSSKDANEILRITI